MSVCNQAGKKRKNSRFKSVYFNLCHEIYQYADGKCYGIMDFTFLKKRMFIMGPYEIVLMIYGQVFIYW